MKKILLLTVGAIGTLQVLGHLTGSPLIRGLGMASGIAPFPKVFCEAEGYEPFAAKFHLVGKDAEGFVHEIPIDAERYSQLSGPYMRRNVYGAALAYAPRLSDELREHLFSELEPLFEELDLPRLDEPFLRITAREGETIKFYEYPLTQS